MKKKISLLCFGLLTLPSCAPFYVRRSKMVNQLQQQSMPKKAYLSINDIECEECFKLIQGILLPMKGVYDVSLETDPHNYKTAGFSENRVQISYDATVNLNKKQIKMVLEEWNFELKKIEI